jgi:hypothetical protein
MNEDVGEKVSIAVPAKNTISTDEMWPDIIHALNKLCAKRGLTATDPKLVWSGSWAEASVHPEHRAVCESCPGEWPADFLLHIFEATAHEAVSA